jgi:hypothetical protein
LKGIHSPLREKADLFQEQIDRHSGACIKLQIVQPLDLKTGLGRLSKISSPYSLSFSVPHFDYFLGTLIAYKSKLEGYLKDPNWTAPPDPNEGVDHGPFLMSERPNRAI